MSSPESAPGLPAPGGAVFLSYASQDGEAVRRIAEALRTAGVEVWFDQNELVGGDAWDQKIRGQIKACALFVPVISSATQARREGYFRLEWKLAAQRTHMISERQAFLLPVVIDATSDAAADVPEEFRAVQWTRLRQGYGGQAPDDGTEKFCARVGKLLGGESRDVSPRRQAGEPVEGPGRLGETSLARKLRRAWLWPLVFGAAVLVALAVVASRTWRGAEANLASATAGSRPEVAALLERVRALTRKTDVVRAELDAAVGLLEQAAKLDQADPEVWASWALVDCRYASEWLDRSKARFDLAQRHSTQAIGLDPKSPAARLARATTMTLLSSDRATKLAAVAMLEPLVGEPGDRADALMLLSNLKWDLGDADEASSYLDRAARYPGRLGQVHYQRAARYLFSGQCQRSQDEIDRALAVEPAAKFQLWKSYLLMIWQGDVEGSRRVMREIPPAMLVEDFPASARYFVSLWARDYDGAVAAMRAVPRDYLESGALRGPTGYFKGYALARWGKPAAAETEWRAALDVVERRLGTQPNERGLLSFKALLLKSLGETAAAERTWRTLRELYGASIESWEDHFARLEILPDEEAINYLAEGAKQSQPMTLAASLRLDPFVDRLRTNPQFVELLARIEADPRLSPKAKPATATGTTAFDARSVAVLAFDNRSDDKDAEYFSDGVSDELIAALQRVPGLTVKGRTSAFYFKGKQVKSEEIGRQLGVTYLVRGSVRKDGNRVRITAELTRAATDEPVWSSEPITKEVKDMLVVQEEIAGMIAKSLSLKISGAAQALRPVQPEAFRLLVEGRHFWNLRSPEGLARAEELFAGAAKLDPLSAAVHEALGDLWTMQGLYRGLAGEPFTDLLARGEAAARQALLLDAERSQPHATLGMVALLRTDWAAAERAFQTAIARAPNNPTAHDWYGDLLHETGRLDLAIESYRRAEQLDPLAYFILSDVGWACLNARRHAEALGPLERAAALVPGSARIDVQRVASLAGLGRFEEARALMRTTVPALMAGQAGFRVANAIQTMKTLGQTDEARRLAETALSRLPPENYLRGMILMTLGEHDAGFAVLEKIPTLGVHSRWLFWDPEMDAVRDDPRFERLLVRLNCAENYKVARATLARMLKEQEAKK